MQPLYTNAEFESSKYTNILPLRCLHCEKTFYRPKKFIEVAIWNQQKGRRKYAADFCSIQCFNAYVHISSQVQVVCNQCGNISLRSKSQAVRSEHHFCSHSCSAKYNLLGRPGARKYFFCNVCHKQIKKNKSLICMSCRSADIISKLTKSAKGELRGKRSGYQSYRSEITKHARYVFRLSNVPRKCAICGYDKHIEIAHIKSVSSFPDSSLIGDINDIKNLQALCPNHHWEHDHKALESGSGDPIRTDDYRSSNRL